MRRTFILATILGLAPAVASAHHGSSSQFDSTKTVDVKGIITEIAFVNPHAYVYFDVTGSDGTVATWNCEMRAASVLKRSGWTEDMFAPGTSIEVVGVASRKDPHGCYTETVSLDGGEAIERYEQLDENKQEVETYEVARTPWGTPKIEGDWAAPQRLLTAPRPPQQAGESAEGGPMGGPPGGAARRGGSPGAEERPTSPVPLTAAGEVTYAKYLEAAAQNPELGRLDCSPRDFFQDWTFDQQPNQVIQSEDEITIKYGFMDSTRTIDMTATSFPENMEPRWVGHSIGRWEGDTLVVETTGFTEAYSRGWLRSDAFFTREEFSFHSDDNGLHRKYIAMDPKFWKPWHWRTGEDVVYPSDYPYEPYNCDDRTYE